LINAPFVFSSLFSSFGFNYKICKFLAILHIVWKSNMKPVIKNPNFQTFLTCSTSKIIKNLIRNQTTCKYGLFLFLQKLMKLNYGFNKKNHDVVRAAVS